ncbi:hypothetical protein ASPCAL02808 [Aspergillus calidoustus]|uniref:Uncharacterized protein n=1 Tax=Aspergillus calidoustus TaxID=454130 RepID=A0A0U5GPH6_ASPCI|nr:hypothetical protein ASPCAL02808 [Aspergillus calidoustus]
MFAPVFTAATLAMVCNNSLWSRCLAMIQEIDDEHHHPAAPLQIGQWASRSILELVGIGILGQSSGWLAWYPDLAETFTRRHANGQHAKAILFPRPVRSLLMPTLFGRRELSDLAYLESVARDLVQTATAKQEQELGQRAPNSNSNSPPNLIRAMLNDGNPSLNLSGRNPRPRLCFSRRGLRDDLCDLPVAHHRALQTSSGADAALKRGSRALADPLTTTYERQR